MTSNRLWKVFVGLAVAFSGSKFGFNHQLQETNPSFNHQLPETSPLVRQPHPVQHAKQSKLQQGRPGHSINRPETMSKEQTLNVRLIL